MHCLTLPFSPGNFFTRNDMTVISHPPYFSLYPQLKIKPIGLHFDRIDVIEADSLAVLNTLTEHDFQDALKNGRSVGNGAYARRGTTSTAMVASSPRVSF
jgi:hypothetical protein